MGRAECGTYSGAQSHTRRGEPYCHECSDASATYAREWRRRRMLGLIFPARRDLTEPEWLGAGGDLAQLGAVLRRGWIESA